MKRYSEVVLNGHPDKFCDLISDRIIKHAYGISKDAYAQVEVAVWSDQLFLTGGVVTDCKLAVSLRDIIVEVGDEIGYTKDNHIDVRKYIINDHICWMNEAPAKWTSHVNDQSIVIGYAGYDSMTHFLPPEHFAAWYFREQIIQALKSGILQEQGPDGKILIVMDENENEWRIKKLVCTLQQQEKISFTDFIGKCNKVLHMIFNQLNQHDKRWIGEWKETDVLINPNGPLTNGGSDGDNGQTGRKLVMDYYGPRIPLGGGALYGKDLSHIDRLASFAARKYAIEQVSQGSKEALVHVCFAPGMNRPLDVTIKSNVRPHVHPYQYFNFTEMHKQINPQNLDYDLLSLGTFYNEAMTFNNREEIISQFDNMLKHERTCPAMVI
jgi:S-adenosylmethionine synthetase